MLNINKILSFVFLLLLAACARGKFVSDVLSEQQCAANDAVSNVWVAPVTLSGVKYCPNSRRCSSDPLLPPQACAQPMPTYYGDLSEVTVADGVLLIHPMTRAKVLCLDQFGVSAVDCAEQFRLRGYVLVTDVPQFAGKYDFLKDGTYPTRRWRKDEHIPRW